MIDATFVDLGLVFDVPGFELGLLFEFPPDVLFGSFPTLLFPLRPEPEFGLLEVLDVLVVLDGVLDEALEVLFDREPEAGELLLLDITTGIELTEFCMLVELTGVAMIALILLTLKL